MQYPVEQLSDQQVSEWDAYVATTPKASFFHRAGWRTVLEQAFGHTAYYLYTRAGAGGPINGILPLVQMKSLLFGNHLVSTPFCVYGGIVAENTEAAAALREAACELASTLKVAALELRNDRPSGSDWPTKTLYYTFRREIFADHDANMQAIPNKRRAMIRKGIKAGLQGEEDRDWRRFYAAYAESVRNLGTPVFSARYFQLLRDVFEDDCRILMITHQGQDVAGVLSFYYKDQVLPYYAGSFDSAKHLKAHDFMYWELMSRACDEGLKVFDFGRSKADTGPYLFKRGWGFEPEPLHYEYFLVTADRVPQVNPANPKYRLFIDLWKRLPLPVANRLGPLLSRSLG